jgi:DNA-binding GntR family transcriptional regulator
MHGRDCVLTDEPVTDYQRVTDGILGKIRSGEWPVGEAIPSTPKLAALYGVSPQPVRKAVGQLQRDGILRGHGGKGVYVKAMPAAAEADMRDLKALGEDIAELKRRLAGYEDLRELVQRIEAGLAELYGMTGHTYAPAGDGQPETAARRG